MKKNKIVKIVKSIQSRYSSAVLQGSFVFFLKQYITRIPNDIDILFTNNSLKIKNKIFRKIKQRFSNFDPFDTECKSHFEICTKNDKDPIIVESILAKTIKKKYIEDYKGIKITNDCYLISSKICQILSNFYLYDYLNKKAREFKINNAINDLCSLLEKHNDKLNKSINFSLILDNIEMNLYYDLLATKYHYINYLNDPKFLSFLKEINTNNSLKILKIINNIKINIHKIEFINKIFKTRDYFMNEILYKFQLLKKFRFDKNYGLTFYIKHDLLALNQLIQFIRNEFKEYQIDFHNSIIAK